MVLINCVVIAFIFLIMAIYSFVNRRSDCVYSGGEVYPKKKRYLKYSADGQYHKPHYN